MTSLTVKRDSLSVIQGLASSVTAHQQLSLFQTNCRLDTLLLWSSPVMGMLFYSVSAARSEPAILLKPPCQSPALSPVTSVTVMLRLGNSGQTLLKDRVYRAPSLSEDHCLVTLQVSDGVCAAQTEASKHSADIACRPESSPLGSQAVYIE